MGCSLISKKRVSSWLRIIEFEMFEVSILDLTHFYQLFQIDPANYKSISSGFGVLLKEQGARGFFRGWVPCLVSVLRGLASLGSTRSLRRPTQIWLGLRMP